MNAIRTRAIETLRHLVLDALADRKAAVWLFGSCISGKVRHSSDIDVAILPREQLPDGFFAELAEAVEESTIPYDVDLVDLRSADPALIGEVYRGGVKWRD
ncbi:MAG: nucleotidyltransferase domain-containing protein [Alphaproteobacteria bacterium]|nr:nucleotidyltransferase domain-containing protein [Alphaproteobacteria bacterium]